MQLRTALKTGLESLLQNQVPSAQLAAELLLMHVLNCDRAFLHSNAGIELPVEKVQCYFELIDERCTGKPTQYITGHQEFWGLDFEVSPDVLIPRPETEHAVEQVLELARRSGWPKDARLRIVDVGTGSGCIALALASELPRAILFGADISRPALVVASRNAVRLGMPERVKFLESDLLGRLLEKISLAPLILWLQIRRTSGRAISTGYSGRCGNSNPASLGETSSAATKSMPGSSRRLWRCLSPAAS